MYKISNLINPCCTAVIYRFGGSIPSHLQVAVPIMADQQHIRDGPADKPLTDDSLEWWKFKANGCTNVFVFFRHPTSTGSFRDFLPQTDFHFAKSYS